MGSNGLKRLPGNYAIPRPLEPLLVWPALGGLGRARLAALAAPGESLILDNVAGLLEERYAQVAWVRLGVVDADPGGLLLTLLDGVAQLNPAATTGLGDAAARWSRRGEWGQAYRLLGETLGAVTARPAVVVLEGAEHLDMEGPATLELLTSVLLPALRNDLDILLIGFAEWDRQRLGSHRQVLGPQQLRLDLCAASLVAEMLNVDMPTAALRGSLAVTGGAAGALRAAFSASAALGIEALMEAVAQAASGSELLAELGGHMLTRTDDATRAALAGAIRLGVWHPKLSALLGHKAVRWDEPWWLNLTEGWRQLIPAWRAPLVSIGAAAALNSASLISLADDMARQGVADRAVELYLEAGEAGRALETAVGLAEELARRGCWSTMIRLGRDLTDPAAAITGRPFEQDGVANRQARPRWWRRMPGRRLPGQADPLRSRSDRSAPAAPALDVVFRRPLESSRVTTGSAFAAPVLKAPPPVTVHLLGDLQVVFGERPVEKWVSGRGRAVFEYLVFHRHSRVRRERLMNVFWPDAAPDAARNSLNVAIHGLRQSLRPAAGDRPVVVHRDGTYFIELALDLWVDVEVFEEQLKSARHHLAADDYAVAQVELETAIELYQGDFLADDPYEEWAHITREHLRLAYLDCLDQLCCLRFEAGDYSGCVETSLKLLACDNCREDTLRRLMRCYSRLGRPQLALRQYHSSAAALRRELTLSPAAATTELAGRIMRRQAVLAFAGRGEHALRDRLRASDERLHQLALMRHRPEPPGNIAGRLLNLTFGFLKCGRDVA